MNKNYEIICVKGIYIVRKELKVNAMLYPQPVIMLATYNEDGSVDVMNAAWGGTADVNQIMVSLTPSHQTVKNFTRTKGVTISLPSAKYVKEADYFGMVSSSRVKDKFERSGLHASKASAVNAPVIEEFPLCFECEFESVDEQGIYFFKVKKITANEEVLDENGKFDLAKADAILFDASGRYFKVGEFLARAFVNSKL